MVRQGEEVSPDVPQSSGSGGIPEPKFKLCTQLFKVHAQQFKGLPGPAQIPEGLWGFSTPRRQGFFTEGLWGKPDIWSPWIAGTVSRNY